MVFLAVVAVGCVVGLTWCLAWCLVFCDCCGLVTCGGGLVACCLLLVDCCGLVIVFVVYFVIRVDVLMVVVSVYFAACLMRDLALIAIIVSLFPCFWLLWVMAACYCDLLIALVCLVLCVTGIVCFCCYWL